MPLPLKLTKIDAYYKLAKVTPVVTPEILNLHIRLPLVIKEREFLLYEMIPFPFESAPGTYIKYDLSPHRYVAINDAQTEHLLLTEDDMKSCYPGDIAICQ